MATTMSFKESAQAAGTATRKALETGAGDDHRAAAKAHRMALEAANKEGMAWHARTHRNEANRHDAKALMAAFPVYSPAATPTLYR